MRDCQLSPITKWDMPRHIKTRQAAVKCTKCSNRHWNMAWTSPAWRNHRAKKRRCDLLAKLHLGVTSEAQVMSFGITCYNVEQFKVRLLYYTTQTKKIKWKSFPWSYKIKSDKIKKKKINIQSNNLATKNGEWLSCGIWLLQHISYHLHRPWSNKCSS